MLKTEVKRFLFVVVAHLYEEDVGVEPAQCEGGGDGGDDEDVPHKRAEEQEEQEEHSSNLKEQQQGLFLVYMHISTGAMKQGWVTCDTFKAFNLTYLHVLCS